MGGAFLLSALSTAALAAACGSSPSTGTSSDAGTGPGSTFDGSGPSGVFTTDPDGGGGTSVIATAVQFVPPQATLTVDGGAIKRLSVAVVVQGAFFQVEPRTMA